MRQKWKAPGTDAMIIDQTASSIDKKGRPWRAYQRRSYTLAWVNWGKEPGIPEGHARGIKGVPEARYLPIGGGRVAP